PAAIRLVPRLPGGSSDRPEGNGRATRAQPGGRGPPPTRSCSGGGLPSVRPHERTGRALTSPFHPYPGREARGGLFSVALSPGRPGPPLTATLPCGGRTFLPPRRAGLARLLP